MPTSLKNLNISNRIVKNDNKKIFLVKFLLNKIKNDKKFFDTFMNFLKRNENKHDLIIRIVREKLIESCMKNFREK